MRELKTLVTPPVQESKPATRHRSTKTWIKAKQVHNGRDKNINSMVEHYYKQILDFSKMLISTLPDAYSRTFYERDSRYDNTENCLAMHSFIAPSFYWYLECDFAYYYRVEYDFHQCPFEDEIRAKFSRMETLVKYAQQRNLNPNCEEFLKRVFKVQDEIYQFVL